MGVEIILLPNEILNKDIRSYLVIIIDVLRMSSTIITALAEGADKVIPVSSIIEAKKKREYFDSKKVLLCGERNGIKIPGFNLGNSPREYMGPHIKGKTIILSTTNGTKALSVVRKAEKIIIGSFLNIGAIVSYCQKHTNNILLVCAGDRGNISLEDTVCAGMIKHLIEVREKRDISFFLNDDEQIAYLIYQQFNNDLLKMLEMSIWGQRLKEIGFGEDLIFCAQKNLYKVIPAFENDCLVMTEKF